MKKPLAVILRPKTISEMIGQKHLFEDNSVLNRMIKNKALYSLIFYGVPGIGKTSIAIALANDLNVSYSLFNAAIDKKEQLIQIVDAAKKTENGYVIILEEVHRMNKDKQDILLPYLENGTVTMFATTTENPYFTINPAVRSRCQIFELNQMSADEVYEGLRKRLKTIELNVNIPDNILLEISKQTNGDLRAALNIIDMLDSLYANEEITLEKVKQIMQQSYLLSSSYGDEYYDVQSAFHKSLRGSDPDAAIYYLARLLQAGDLTPLCRRLIACAYEDIGLANPQLCLRVANSVSAARELGFPECRLVFAAIVIEMALSPKSNSACLAIDSALKTLEDGGFYQIPKVIKDQSYNSAKKLGRTGYKYPHNFPNRFVDQQYLPKELTNKKFYNPHFDNSIEKNMYESFNHRTKPNNK